MAAPIRRSGIRIIIEILKDPDRKPLLRIIPELLYLAFFYRKLPFHYFSRYLFKKDRKNITDYYPDKFLDKLKYSFNDFSTCEVLENKLYFNYFFDRLNISTPETLMFNSRTTFVTGNKGVKISDGNDFISLLNLIFSNNPNVDSIFVKKMSGSYGGDKVYKIYRDHIQNDLPGLVDLYTEVIKSEYIFQKTIVQHKQMDIINSSCVNTIRIDTFMDKEGKLDIMSAFLRTSIAGLHVDNITSGGARIPIDMETGKLMKTGFSSLSTYGVKVLDAHPVTNIKFDGFLIPCFDEVKKIVLDAAGYIPSLRLVGWDVGIGENGPVIIEGNSYYSIPGNDLASGGYRSHAVFRKVVREYYELKKIKRFQSLTAFLTIRKK